MYIVLFLTVTLLSAINITLGGREETIIFPFPICPRIPCLPNGCTNFTCPEGQTLGWKYLCGCCKECVIPEGGECWESSTTPSSSNSNSSTEIVATCEFGLTCCRGICSRSCFEEPITESTTTESTTSESTTTESTTEPTISVT